MFLELNQENYNDIRLDILKSALGKDSGQYLWNDGESDQCGKSIGKSLNCARFIYLCIDTILMLNHNQ